MKFIKKEYILSPDLFMNVKFRFVIAETLEAVVKASNIVKLYVSSFKERYLLFTIYWLRDLALISTL